MHALSEAYAKKVEQWSSSERWLLEMQFFLSRNELCGARVLDYGCGMGRAYRVAEELGASGYQGVDVNPHYHYGRLGPRGTTHRLTPGEKLPFQRGAFDVAFLFHVLPYLGTPLDALSDVCRCVRPGGLLGIALTNANYRRASLLSRWWTGYREDQTLHRRHTMGSMRRLIDQFGRIRSADSYGPKYMGIGPSLRAHVWVAVP